MNKRNNTATNSPVGIRRSSRKAKSTDSPKSNESESESARISSAKFTEIQQCVKVNNALDDSSGSDSDHVTASIASAKSTEIQQCVEENNAPVDSSIIDDLDFNKMIISTSDDTCKALNSVEPNESLLRVDHIHVDMGDKVSKNKL